MNDELQKYPRGARITIAVIFEGEYRVTWEYQGKEYLQGGYYSLTEALSLAWMAFQTTFPELDNS